MKKETPETLVQSLAQIAREIEKAEHARQERLKATHGRFNLFTTLLKAHDEVRLHTRYLTHLLDPKGKHDCDGLFLDLFLQEVGLSNSLTAEACIYVKNEHCTGDLGNIDIYMEFRSAVVVVENKIYAGDQSKQLQRYAEYAQTKGQDVHLFYLTLDGSDPSEQSCGSLKDGDYRLISYRGEILKWIEACLQKTYNLVNINQALQQYKAVINQLLGKTMEKQEMAKLAELIKEAPALCGNIRKVNEALIYTRDSIINQFWSELKKELEDRADFDLVLRNGDVDAPANLAHIGRGGKQTGLRLTKQLVLEYRADSCELFVGAFPEIARANKVNEALCLKLKGARPTITAGKWWGLECWLHQGNNSFADDEFWAKMVDDSSRKREVSRCVEEICGFVDLVQEALDKG
jgi:hypothetical protein